MAAEFINKRIPGCSVVPYPLVLVEGLSHNYGQPCLPELPPLATIARSKTSLQTFTYVSAFSSLCQSLFGNVRVAEFHVIVSGLDSIVARRWINGLVVCAHTRTVAVLFISLVSCLPQLSLLRYSDDGELDQSSIVPLIDGGSEGQCIAFSCVLIP